MRDACGFEFHNARLKEIIWPYPNCSIRLPRTLTNRVQRSGDGVVAPSLSDAPEHRGSILEGSGEVQMGSHWLDLAPIARRRINRRGSLRGVVARRRNENQGKLAVQAVRVAWNGFRRLRPHPRRIAGSSETANGSIDRMVGFRENHTSTPDQSESLVVIWTWSEIHHNDPRPKCVA